MRHLPTFTTLRAFEAAARLGSFTKAADELAMTQPAVSYQIKQLEEQLGAVLFHRAGRTVELTPTGQRLAGSLTESFGLIRNACAAVAEQSSSRLQITALPTVASNWLVPRLADFQVKHPQYAVRLDASIEVEDLRTSPFDVAIRTGRGDWPGCEATRLFASTYTVLCAPEMVEKGRLRDPSGLAHVPLFGRQDWWEKWLAAAGTPAKVSSTDLGTQTSEVKAALMREGAAIATPAFFTEELEAGTLVQPFEVTVTSSSDYWLVYRKGSHRFPNVRDFRRWMLDQAQPLVTV